MYYLGGWGGEDRGDMAQARCVPFRALLAGESESDALMPVSQLPISNWGCKPAPLLYLPCLIFP